MYVNPHELSLAPLALRERVGPSSQADRENAEVQAGKENCGEHAQDDQLSHAILAHVT